MKIPNFHRGFTSTDLIVLLASAFVLLLVTSEWLFSQSSYHPGLDNIANRTACSANLRSLAQSMTIYAQSNEGLYPCTPGPSGGTYSNAPQNPMGYALNHTADEAVSDWYGNKQGPTGASCGNPLACLWLLVLMGQDTSQTFICPSDPLANIASLQYGPVVGAITPSFPNFGFIAAGNTTPNMAGQGESYSIADPWVQIKVNTQNALHPWAPGGGIVGLASVANPMWINDTRADQPIISDMAPAGIKAAGKFNRDTTQPQEKGFNDNTIYLFSSGNHNGAGQNVAFADTHVEWDTSPYVGEQGDNIFTFNASTTSNAGGTPLNDLGTSAKVPNIQTTAPPYDTCMIPIRNVKTGQW